MNKITCEIACDRASRWAVFGLSNGQGLCSVSQRADTTATPIVMAECRISPDVSYWGGLTTSEAELRFEANRQGLELAKRWDEDAGKPAKEILSDDRSANA